MNFRLVLAFLLPIHFLSNVARAQKLTPDIPYVENGHKRHVLDVYTPQAPAGRSLPVMFWIHGGGWQAGDKSDVALKPKVLNERGFIFVSTNYRRTDWRRRQVHRVGV
jgi:arylformamidase